MKGFPFVLGSSIDGNVVLHFITSNTHIWDTIQSLRALTFALFNVDVRVSIRQIARMMFEDHASTRHHITISWRCPPSSAVSRCPATRICTENWQVARVLCNLPTTCHAALLLCGLIGLLLYLFLTVKIGCRSVR